MNTLSLSHSIKFTDVFGCDINSNGFLGRDDEDNFVTGSIKLLSAALIK